ncbi:MAG: DUF2703 domain-containing protein [Candidatus Wildermuthbacteria bacterium]|nr:DUF2703 domain-containing protein [Candidatus Wildermuthbacteria bacterium]
MKIAILHNKTCNIWQTTKGIIETTLKENGLEAEIEEIVIANDAEARDRHFAGSPQVLVDGQDIDPEAQKVTNYHESGCRFYIWKDKLHEGPPKEMLGEAILRKNKF